LPGIDIVNWLSSFELALGLQIIIWLGVIFVFVLSGQATIFHPLTMYLGFHALVFIVRPLLVYFFNFDSEFAYMGIRPDEALMARVLMITSFALVVFAATNLWFGRCDPKFQNAAPVAFTVEQRRALIILTLALLPIIIYSMHAQATNWTGENIGGTYILTGASGYAIDSQLMAAPLLCAWLAVKRFRWTVWPWIIPYVGYRVYTGWGRWSFVLLFVSLVFIYVWQSRRKWLPWWTLLIPLAIFPLFRMVGNDRDVIKELITHQYDPTSHGPAVTGLSAADRFRVKNDNPDFANFDFLVYVVEMVPERTQTFTYGTQYLQIFTEPIPRKLWKGKPAGAPVGFFNLNNYGDFNGCTVSVVGDGWLSGGWLGVFITVGIVGSLLGIAHRWFWRNSDNNMISLFYLVGLAMLPQWYRDGGISISKFLLWNELPLVFWLILSWIFRGGFVPVYSAQLPVNARVRFLTAERRAVPAPTPAGDLTQSPLAKNSAP
jgi:hypothetical protein